MGRGRGGPGHLKAAAPGACGARRNLLPRLLLPEPEALKISAPGGGGRRSVGLALLLVWLKPGNVSAVGEGFWICEGSERSSFTGEFSSETESWAHGWAVLPRCVGSAGLRGLRGEEGAWG